MQKCQVPEILKIIPVLKILKFFYNNPPVLLLAVYSEGLICVQLYRLFGGEVCQIYFFLNSLVVSSSRCAVASKPEVTSHKTVL